MNINNIDTNKVTVKTSSISKIKIPMIQRDYVQGLDDKKLVPFLNALINTLSHQSKTQQIETLSLDFIYGNINEDGVFEPIDGQQRLTTLALLTFYLYCRQKNSDNIIKNPFKLITYATRQSAKKFCELLSKNEFKDKFDNSVVPSNVIKENPKYFSEYDEDITISAMLKTLDKIHEIINEKKPNINNDAGQDDIQSFINTLARNIDKINFHIFPMESFNLSDDLYIKMNGRGKQLSSFDNFKADYFKWLEEVCNNDNIDNLIPNSIESDEENKLETLKRKFDTEYLDIFWDYAFENSKDTSEAPDPEKLFFRFINRFVVGKYLFLTDSQKNNIKNDFEKTFFDDGIKSEKDAVVFNNIELYKSILNENDDYKNYTYNYKIINILENLFNLQKCCSNNFKDILNFIFNPLWEDEELNIFPKKDWLTYKHVLVFNAITSFLEQDSIIDNYKCDKCNKLKERVIDNKTFLINEECNIYNILITLKRISRIVWNITEQYNLLNTISKDNYKTVISRLDFSKLSKTDNVYDKFINICKYIDVKNQNDIDIIIEDEVKKCQYIFEKTSLEQDFIELEKLPYLKGTIGFLIQNYCKDSTIDQNTKKYFSNKKDYNDFLRALISMVKTKDILINTMYRSNIVLGQLINKKEMRENAYDLLKDDHIVKLIERKYNIKSPLRTHIDNYKKYTLVCQHEGLYRFNKIDHFKIYETYGVTWLLTIEGHNANNKNMISFCPIRNSLIHILCNINGLDNLIITSVYSNKYYKIKICNNAYELHFDAYSIMIFKDKDKYITNISLKDFIDTNKVLTNTNDCIYNIFLHLINVSNDIEDLEELAKYLSNFKDKVYNFTNNLKHQIDPFDIE